MRIPILFILLLLLFQQLIYLNAQYQSSPIPTTTPTPSFPNGIPKISFRTTFSGGATRGSIHSLSFNSSQPLRAGEIIGLTLERLPTSNVCGWAEPATLRWTYPGMFPESDLYGSDCQVFALADLEQHLRPRPIPMNVYSGTSDKAPIKNEPCSIQFELGEPLFPHEAIHCYIKIPTVSTLENAATLKLLPIGRFQLANTIHVPTINLEARPHLHLNVLEPGWSYDGKVTRYDLVEITVTDQPAFGSIIPLDLHVMVSKERNIKTKQNNSNENDHNDENNENEQNDYDDEIDNENENSNKKHHLHREYDSEDDLESFRFPATSQEYLVHQALAERPAIHCDSHVRLYYNTHSSQQGLFLIKSLPYHNPTEIYRTHCYIYLNLGLRLMQAYPYVDLNTVWKKRFEFAGPRIPQQSINLPRYTTTGYNTFNIQPNVWGSISGNAPSSTGGVGEAIVMSVRLNAIGFEGDDHFTFKYLGFSSMANETIERQYQSFLEDSFDAIYRTYNPSPDEYHIPADAFKLRNEIELSLLPRGSTCVTVDIQWRIPLQKEELTPFIIDFELAGKPITFTISQQFRIMSTVTHISDYSFTTQHSIQPLGIYINAFYSNTPFYVPPSQRSFQTPKINQTASKSSYTPGYPSTSFILYDLGAFLGKFIDDDYSIFSSCDAFSLETIQTNSTTTNIIEGYSRSAFQLYKYQNTHFKSLPVDISEQLRLFNFTLPNFVTEKIHLVCQSKLRQKNSNNNNNPNNNHQNNNPYDIDDQTTDEIKKPNISYSDTYFGLSMTIVDEFGQYLSFGGYSPPSATIGTWSTYPTANTINFIAYYTQPILGLPCIQEFLADVVSTLQNAKYTMETTSGIELVTSTMFKRITQDDIRYMQAPPRLNHWDNAFFPQSFNPADEERKCRGLVYFDYNDPYCEQNELISRSRPSNGARLSLALQIDKLIDFTWDAFERLRFSPPPKSSLLLLPDIDRGGVQIDAQLGPKLSDVTFNDGVFPIPVGAPCTLSRQCAGTGYCIHGSCKQENNLGLTPNQMAELFSTPQFSPFSRGKAHRFTTHWYEGSVGLFLWISILWFCATVVIFWLLTCWWTGLWFGCIKCFRARCRRTRDYFQ